MLVVCTRSRSLDLGEMSMLVAYHYEISHLGLLSWPLSGSLLEKNEQ
jgi:hypothetical protein